MSLPFSSFALSLIVIFLSICHLVISQPFLSSPEQESVYQILELVNSDISWRTLFPDDLCYSSQHGVVCDYFINPNSSTTTQTLHVTELSFGYVSDYSPNPPCTRNSTFDPSSLSSLTHLRKLFFYKCFTDRPVPLPDLSDFGSSLEELIFIENPSLIGSLSGNISKLSSLKRLILTGTNVSGGIPHGFGELLNIEEVTVSRNRFSGEISSVNVSKLKKLKVLDLSQNGLNGSVSESIGGLENLLKLDLSLNGFSGQVPESLKGLKKLEFLDLSYNKFANFGVPLFIGEMPRLKEVYLSGNNLGGQIPEIWENLGGITGIGLSGTGLIGNIPASMGLFLKNLCYLGLDNNKLVGTVPKEFGALELVSELNLGNNNLSGRVPFSAKFVSEIGDKLKLEGNPDLCVEEGLRSAKISGSLGQLRICKKTDISTSVLFHGGGSSVPLPRVFLVISWVSSLFLLLVSGD